VCTWTWAVAGAPLPGFVSFQFPWCWEKDCHRFRTCPHGLSSQPLIFRYVPLIQSFQECVHQPDHGNKPVAVIPCKNRGHRVPILTAKVNSFCYWAIWQSPYSLLKACTTRSKKNSPLQTIPILLEPSSQHWSDQFSLQLSPKTSLWSPVDASRNTSWKVKGQATWKTVCTNSICTQFLLKHQASQVFFFKCHIFKLQFQFLNAGERSFEGDDQLAMHFLSKHQATNLHFFLKLHKTKQMQISEWHIQVLTPIILHSSLVRSLWFLQINSECMGLLILRSMEILQQLAQAHCQPCCTATHSNNKVLSCWSQQSLMMCHVIHFVQTAFIDWCNAANCMQFFVLNKLFIVVTTQIGFNFCCSLVEHLVRAHFAKVGCSMTILSCDFKTMVFARSLNEWGDWWTICVQFSTNCFQECNVIKANMCWICCCERHSPSLPTECSDLLETCTVNISLSCLNKTNSPNFPFQSLVLKGSWDISKHDHQMRTQWLQGWNIFFAWNVSNISALKISRNVLNNQKQKSSLSIGFCWKMCASATVVSLKFPLQDPQQTAATGSNNHTTTISGKLICFHNRTDLFVQHLPENVWRARGKRHTVCCQRPIAPRWARGIKAKDRAPRWVRRKNDPAKKDPATLSKKHDAEIATEISQRKIPMWVVDQARERSRFREQACRQEDWREEDGRWVCWIDESMKKTTRWRRSESQEEPTRAKQSQAESRDCAAKWALKQAAKRAAKWTDQRATNKN